ncbi:hypothetical protein NQ315_010643 [Exocentrus adspersus]|uniref:Uncharacterized protein n=1 Tax=Exocentrus adspersus TaxID=1586481 RepID=A0AAV8W5I0_9CUCU|nr:hypothetical protein NQ315_010643 [Exocentrus adspersus]
MEPEYDSFVPTKGSVLQKEKTIDFQEVSYESYKSAKEKKIGRPQTIKDKAQVDFNIKKAKQEIIKFGMSGFDPHRKEEAEIQLAIKLGAKPPKNKYINYKELQADKRKKQQKEKIRQSLQQLGKNSMGKSVAKGKSFDRKRRKEKSDILSIYGKVKT